MLILPLVSVDTSVLPVRYRLPTYHLSIVPVADNIGTDFELSNLDVIKKIVEILKPDDDYNNYIEFVKDRPWNDLRYGVNCEDLKNLGWKEEYDFDKGLRETIEWYNKS